MKPKILLPLIFAISIQFSFAQHPIFDWVKQADGISEAITIDNNGYIYITGFFNDTAIFGDTSLISNGGSDIFIAKYDSNSNFIWAIQAGGNGYDYSKSISSIGNSDIFIAKIKEDTTVNINETFFSSFISLYPNPANNFINI